MRIVIKIIAVFSLTTLWSQQPKDTLNTEVVNVIKPYTPTISDAFKIKDVPSVFNESFAKESIDYQINSIPVASTFSPSKGKAKNVKRPKKEQLFDNYISFGFGNYTTPLLEAYTRSFPDKYSEFGVLLKHHSSQGGIKDLLFNDSFYNTNLNLYYKQSSRNMDWKLSFDGKHHLYHWYGLPRSIDFTTEFLKNYDSKQSYVAFGIGGDLMFYDSSFKGGKATIRNLSDRYDSNEMQIKMEPILEFPISSELIQFVFDIDYVKGNFKRNYSNTSVISYTYINLGVTPNFIVVRDDLHFNLGVKLYASTGAEENIQLRAYPNVSASYQLLEEVLTVFGGATGGLHQNTYLNLLEENPYLSPNFNSIQTDEKFRAYGGIKGKLASNISFLFKASFSDERNKPLYLLNAAQTEGNTIVEEVYKLGNSFSVLYDDVKTLLLQGELAIDLSKEITFGGNLDYATYNLKTQLEAWNLPNLKATLFADYHANKWTGSAKLFLVGNRKDIEIPFNGEFQPYDAGDFDMYTKTISSYMDLNVGISYAFTNRLSAFAKAHNLLGTQYERFYNYPVQGTQVLGGITYKFD